MERGRRGRRRKGEGEKGDYDDFRSGSTVVEGHIIMTM